MADRGSGCWSVIFMLPSAILWAFRQEAWHRSFPRPHKLHTAQEAMDIVAELMSDHGGGGAAFPYAQRALEFEPENLEAAKFMANYYVPQKKFTEALPYVILSSHAKESWYFVPTWARIAVTLRHSVSKVW